MLFSEPKIPQSPIWLNHAQPVKSFSALQRAENSSISKALDETSGASGVSVLFSEPKIPQSTAVWIAHPFWRSVSVLFSEPKIPQFYPHRLDLTLVRRFSALQRAENSSISTRSEFHAAARNVSVLFSEPKIPQFYRFSPSRTRLASFSALQRAENSSRSGDRGRAGVS